MKKTLRIESLAVESFPTLDPEGEAEGASVVTWGCTNSNYIDCPPGHWDSYGCVVGP
jgi:hypothetical protein